ncbi:MarR family winged helix-turn-helix transcriptional regulator [Hylemonella sp. W303a]|uniref:MarR family winged helix-turn-helix transcriptional regulator n=1 Tax=Hylemonella sp. W303a TaxID=3389873 RepID=UPI00396B413E
MARSQDTLGFLLADIMRQMRRIYAQRLQGTSMTLAQAKVLLNVERHPGIRQVDLAELLDIQPITLARLVDQLSQSGLVERRADPQDRRAYQLHLRPEAMPILDTIAETAAGVHAEALQGVPAAQAATLMNVLRTVRDNLGQR